MSDRSPLVTVVERYIDSDPAAAARCLETMGEEEAAQVLGQLPPRSAAETVRQLEHVAAALILAKMGEGPFREIARQLDAQQGATILRHFPAELRDRYLAYLDADRKRQIQEILTYPEDSAGRMMTTDFLAFHGDIRVRDAIARIRQLAQQGSPASYLYVVDKDNRLAGVMNMRDMMLADPDDRLETIMRRKVFAVDCFMDREAVAHELSERRFFAVPVVDAQQRLLGVVKVEHLIDGLQDEATEDFQKMFGAGGDERAFSPVGFSLAKRLPWLYVNLATAFLAAAVVALFEDLIARITVLAVFLPVVAGQGGNAGAQSLAVVMRSLVMREIPADKIRALVWKETLVGTLNGVAIGIVTGLIAWAWHGNPYLGVVIGLGMLANLVVAGFSGAAIPLAMKAMRLDPAQCSSIILTTITDVMGFFAFLGLALVFQRFLS